MTAANKSLIIKVIIGIAIVFGLVKMCSSDEDAIKAEQQAAATHKTAVGLVKQARTTQREVNDKALHSSHVYDPSLLQQELDTLRSNMEKLRQEGDGFDNDLKSVEGALQPKAVVESSKQKLKRLEAINAELNKTSERAHQQYQQQTAQWEKPLPELIGLVPILKTMDTHCQAIEKKRKEVTKELNHNLGEGYEVAAATNKSTHTYLNRFLKSWAKEKKSLLDDQTHLQTARAALIANDKINPNAPAIQQLNQTLAIIDQLSQPPYNTDLARLPQPDPNEGKPKPFIADLQIATTGDLANALLGSIVEAWVADTHNHGLGLSGEIKRNLPQEGCIELTIPAPGIAGLQEQDVLRIKIVTVPGAEAFQTLSGNAYDLLFTGRVMSQAQEQAWLASLPEQPIRVERGRRVRIASDALIFFRNPDSKLPYAISSNDLSQTAKVFTAAYPGRIEAAEIFQVLPQAGDVTIQDQTSLTNLLNEHPGKLLLGVYHKDRNALPNCLMGTRIDIDTQKIPASYKKNLPQELSYLPTDTTLNSTEYPFAFRINFFRSTSNELAIKLMNYASDKNSKAQAIVKAQGFTPVRLDLKLDTQGRRATLDNKDLPIHDLIRELSQPAIRKTNDFGYDTTDQWVYGVKLPYPIHYQTGSSENLSDMNVDPESVYSLEETINSIIKVAKTGPLAIVMVGHADCTYQGKIMFTKESFEFNKKLSANRAQSAYSTFFQSTFTPDKYPDIINLSLHCSWTRPCREINVSRSAAEQQQNLAWCRRVEVFLIFPKLFAEPESSSSN